MPGLKRFLQVGVRRFLELNTNLYIRRRTPTLVYSMERSGSVSLFQSLQAHGDFVIASHYLDPAKKTLGHHAGTARWAKRHLIAPRRPARIISLVRHPVDNMLSAFARGRFAPSRVAAASTPAPPDAASICSEFVTDYLQTGRYARQLDWFDTEFRAAIGVDVYKHPFDTQAGMGRFRDGPYEVLILRTELDDVSKASAVADFLGLPGFAMTPAPPPALSEPGKRVAPGTAGEQAWYADSYRALKRGAVFPPEIWTAITGSPYARHFLSAREIEDPKARFLTHTASA